MKKWTLNAGTSGLIPKRNWLKFLTFQSPFYFLSEKKILKLNGHPEYFGVYYSWWNHEMRFKMVHFNLKTQNLELCNSRTTHSSVRKVKNFLGVLKNISDCYLHYIYMMPTPYPPHTHTYTLKWHNQLVP